MRSLVLTPLTLIAPPVANRPREQLRRRRDPAPAVEVAIARGCVRAMGVGGERDRTAAVRGQRLVVAEEVAGRRVRRADRGVPGVVGEPLRASTSRPRPATTRATRRRTCRRDRAGGRGTRRGRRGRRRPRSAGTGPRRLGSAPTSIGVLPAVARATAAGRRPGRRPPRRTPDTARHGRPRARAGRRCGSRRPRSAAAAAELRDPDGRGELRAATHAESRPEPSSVPASVSTHATLNSPRRAATATPPTYGPYGTAGTAAGESGCASSQVAPRSREWRHSTAWRPNAPRSTVRTQHASNSPRVAASTGRSSTAFAGGVESVIGASHVRSRSTSSNPGRDQRRRTTAPASLVSSSASRPDEASAGFAPAALTVPSRCQRSPAVERHRGRDPAGVDGRVGEDAVGGDEHAVAGRHGRLRGGAGVELADQRLLAPARVVDVRDVGGPRRERRGAAEAGGAGGEGDGGDEIVPPALGRSTRSSAPGAADTPTSGPASPNASLR